MSLAQKGRKPTQYTEEQKAEISIKISEYFTVKSNGKRTEETKQKKTSTQIRITLSSYIRRKKSQICFIEI